jgi:hypothetical protein
MPAERPRLPGRDRWWAHAARVVAGFALVLALYQLPYLFISPLAARLGVHFEDYLAQLHRFSVAQRQLGGVGPGRAYGALAYFFLFNEGPALVLFLAGLYFALRQRRWPQLLAPSLLVLPFLQTALLIPFARYQSWLLPILAMVAASGLAALAGKGRRAAVVIVASLTVVSAYALYRDAPVITARSQHPAALRWCKAHGAQYIMDTNMSAALSEAPLYRLKQLYALPTEPRAAIQALRHFGAPGRVMVVVETQQFMDSEKLMTVEQYQQSAAALLRTRGRPLWQSRDHLRGLFPFLCFEHNWDWRETLRMMRAHQEEASYLAIYGGEEALRIFEASAASAARSAP